MRAIPGTPRIDAFFIGEVVIEAVAHPDISMRAVIGYVEKETGRRFGSTSKLGGWSPETLAKLDAFLEAVEQDVAKDIFGTTSSGVVKPFDTTTDGVPQL